MVSCSSTKKDDTKLGHDNIIQLNNWSYLVLNEPDSLNSGDMGVPDTSASYKWKPISSPDKISPLYKGEIVWLKTKLPGLYKSGEAIYFRPVLYAVQVFLNKNFIFQRGNFSQPEKKYILWNQNLIQLPSLKEGDVLFFKIKVEKDNQTIIHSILLGSTLEIVSTIYKQNLPDFIILSIILLCGILTLLLYFFFERTNLLLGLFLFLIFAGILLAVNIEFIKLLFKLPALYYQVNYISFQMTAISFFYLLAQIAVDKYRKIITYIWQFKLALFLISIVLFNTTNITFIEIIKYLVFVNLPLIIIALTVLYLSIKKDRKQRNILIAALAVVLISLIIELLMFLKFGISSEFGFTLRAFHFGVIIFVAAIFWLTFQQYRTANLEREMMRESEFEAIKRENEVRQNFTTKLLESQEAERNRIALELHDSVGQNLLLIKNHLLSKIKQSSVQNDLAALNEIGDLADETIQEIRNITYNLRPQYLDQLGLTAAIETIAEKISESSGINISLDIENKIDDLISKNDQINFFRIVQESLNNIVKHSCASEAFVIMKKENNQILLEIRDNGKGFQNINFVSGTGITGMKERAKILGAGLDIIYDESGTKIKMIYPIKAV